MNFEREGNDSSPVNVEPKIRFSDEHPRLELVCTVEGKIEHLSNVGSSSESFELLLSHVGILWNAKSGKDQRRKEVRNEARRTNGITNRCIQSDSNVPVGDYFRVLSDGALERHDLE